MATSCVLGRSLRLNAVWAGHAHEDAVDAVRRSSRFVWIVMILLGSIVLETFMVYPNIFHDPPKSFETALAFIRRT